MTPIANKAHLTLHGRTFEKEWRIREAFLKESRNARELSDELSYDSIALYEKARKEAKLGVGSEENVAALRKEADRKNNAARELKRKQHRSIKEGDKIFNAAIWASNITAKWYGGEKCVLTNGERYGCLDQE